MALSLIQSSCSFEELQKKRSPFLSFSNVVDHEEEEDEEMECVAVGGARNKSKGTNPKRVKKSVYW